MSDQKLTTAAVRDAGLTDWRQILGRLKARFHTGDFATGLDLVNRIGASAEAANHHPDISLSYPEVIVTLVSHDVGGITERDLALAREISAHAAAVGATADPGGLTQLELGLDSPAGEKLAPFYAALLGSEVKNGEPVDASGQVPTICWQGKSDGGPELPDQDFEQRWHFDVWVAADEAERRVQAAIDAGGTLVSDAAAPSYWVLADAEGNRSCICSVTGR